MGFHNKAFRVTLPVLLSSGFLWGCKADIDYDAYRAGAIQIETDITTSDELYPSAGDKIDWKMLFVPTPGNLTINVYWDHPKEVFSVDLGVYDRFGVKIHSERRGSAEPHQVLTVYLVETGLHYIKLSAETGQSIYSMHTSFETNYDDITQVLQAPTFSGYVDLDGSATAMQGSGPGSIRDTSGMSTDGVPAHAREDSNTAGGGAPGGGGPGGPGGAPGEGGGMVLLPQNVSGGVVSGGAPPGGGVPVVVNPGGGGGGGYSGPVVAKTVDNQGAALKEAPVEKVKPIVDDIRGPHKKLEAELLMVTRKRNSTEVRLSVGKRDGVRQGSVVDMYIDGSVYGDGRFRVDKVLDKSCTATTNAGADKVKSASRFVVKIPE